MFKYLLILIIIIRLQEGIQPYDKLRAEGYQSVSFKGTEMDNQKIVHFERKYQNRNVNLNNVGESAFAVRDADNDCSRICELYLEEWMNVTSQEVHNLFYKIGDNNINQLLIMLSLEPITTANRNKTPDIFIHDPVKRDLFIGDVAFTKDINGVTAIKKTKYTALRDDIAERNRKLNVYRLDFIVNANDLTEDMLGNTLRDFRQLLAIPIIKSGSEERTLRLLGRVQVFKRYIFQNTRSYEALKEALTEKKMEFSSGEDIDMMQILKDEVSSAGIKSTKKEKLPQENIEIFERDMVFSIVTETIRTQRSWTDKQPEVTDFEKIKSDYFDSLKRHEKAKVKSSVHIICNLKNNESSSGLALLRSYVDDLDGIGVVSEFLPKDDEMKRMQNMRSELVSAREANTSGVEVDKEMVKGKFGIKNPFFCEFTNMVKSNTRKEFVKRSARRNEKRAVKSIQGEDIEKAINMAEDAMKYLGDECPKGVVTNYDVGDEMHEETISSRAKETLRTDVIDKSNGIQMAMVMSKLGTDATYYSGKKRGFYYSIPVNSSCITVIIKSGKTKTNSDVCFFFITRFEHNDTVEGISSTSIEYMQDTDKYRYYVSKTFRYTFDKIEQLRDIDIKIKMIVSSLSCTKYMRDEVTSDEYVRKLVGLYTMTSLDLHQKPSIILDVMKYVVGMSCSELCNYEQLFEKMPEFLKTDLDAWLVNRVIDYCNANSKISNPKPKDIVFKKTGTIDKSSFGLIGEFSSFCDMKKHKSVDYHLAEAQLLFQSRAKKLYGSQYMDEVVMKVIKNNVKQDEEDMKDKWSFGGDAWIRGFPYGEYSYSSVAIDLALRAEEKVLRSEVDRILKYQRGLWSDFCSSSLSMRGSCVPYSRVIEIIKENERPSFSQPAIYSNMMMIKEMMKSSTSNDENDTDFRYCRFIARNMKEQMVFNMAEKAQRGGGRPIGSPDSVSKQKLRVFEEVFRSIAMHQEENLLNPGVNKSAKIAGSMRSMIEEFSGNDKVEYYHIVMDQSQFSEGDNMRKFKDAIDFNGLIYEESKPLLKGIVENIENRKMIFRRIPNVDDDEKESAYIENKYVIDGKAGWVQGMLNISATYIHICAAKYITNVFEANRVYICKTFEERLSEDTKLKIGWEFGEGTSCNVFKTKHDINSDDSYALVACDNKNVVLCYYKFFEYGKKMFSLKQNTKKSYLSKSIGEIVQKYVLNGNVANIWQKGAVSMIDGIMGIDMIKDGCYITSNMSNLYKEGAPETFLSYMRAIMREKHFRMYGLGSGKFNDMNGIDIDIGKIPQEVGGWPKYVTTFEIAVAGTEAQRYYCLRKFEKEMSKGVKSTELDLVRGSMTMSSMEASDYQLLESLSRFFMFKKKDHETMKESMKRINENVNEERKSVALINEDGSIIEDKKTGIDMLTVSGSEGEWTSFNSPMVKRLMGSLRFKVTLGSKFASYVEKVEEFAKELPEPTGLTGLIKQKTSIKQFWSDMIDGLDFMIMGMVEQGVMQDPKWLSKNLARINTSKCVGIKGAKGLYTIKEAMSVLIKVGRSKEGEMVKWQNILESTIDKAAISHEMTNITVMRRSEINDIIVNRLPKEYGDADFVNDPKHVAAELMQPGSLARAKITPRSPRSMQSDKKMMARMLSIWESDRIPWKSIVVSFVNQLVNTNRRRYITCPAINTQNTRVSIKEMFLNCRDGKYTYQIVGSRNVVSFTKKEQLKRNVQAVVSGVSLYNVMLIREGVDRERLGRGIMVKLAGQEGEEVLMNISESLNIPDVSIFLSEKRRSYHKEQIAIAKYVVNGDKSYCERLLGDRVKVYWDDEQKPVRQKETGRIVYEGPFKATLYFKEDTMIVTGNDTGRLSLIRCTTEEPYMLCEMLKELKNKLEIGERRLIESDRWWTGRTLNSDHKAERTEMHVDFNNLGAYATTEKSTFRNGISIPFKRMKRSELSNPRPLKQLGELKLSGNRMMEEIFAPEGGVEEREIGKINTKGRDYDRQYVSVTDEIIVGGSRLSKILNGKFGSEFVKDELHLMGMNESTEYVIESVGFANIIERRIFDKTMGKLKLFGEENYNPLLNVKPEIKTIDLYAESPEENLRDKSEEILDSEEDERKERVRNRLVELMERIRQRRSNSKYLRSLWEKVDVQLDRMIAKIETIKDSQEDPDLVLTNLKETIDDRMDVDESDELDDVQGHIDKRDDLWEMCRILLINRRPEELQFVKIFEDDINREKNVEIRNSSKTIERVIDQIIDDVDELLD